MPKVSNSFRYDQTTFFERFSSVRQVYTFTTIWLRMLPFFMFIQRSSQRQLTPSRSIQMQSIYCDYWKSLAERNCFSFIGESSESSSRKSVQLCHYLFNISICCASCLSMFQHYSYSAKLFGDCSFYCKVNTASFSSLITFLFYCSSFQYLQVNAVTVVVNYDFQSLCLFQFYSMISIREVISSLKDRYLLYQCFRVSYCCWIFSQKVAILVLSDSIYQSEWMIEFSFAKISSSFDYKLDVSLRSSLC